MEVDLEVVVGAGRRMLLRVLIAEDRRCLGLGKGLELEMEERCPGQVCFVVLGRL